MGTKGKQLIASAARVALTVIAVLELATFARADEQVVKLCVASAQKLSWVTGFSAGPEGDWGHLRGKFVGTGLSFVVASDAPSDAQAAALRESAILTLTKQVFEDAVLPAGGQLGQWLANGTLAGIEFDLFGSSDPTQRPSASQRLGTIGVLRVDIAAAPGYANVGFVYCYDATQFAARLLALADVSSEVIDVYSGPVLHSSASGNYSMHLVTSDTVVQGEVLTNGTFRLDGDQDAIPERVRFRGGNDLRGDGHVLGVLTPEPVDTVLPNAPKSAQHYAGLATANGTFFTHDIVIVAGPTGPETSQGVPIGGVVYSTGDIIVSGTDLHGSLTLVAEGSVEFGGTSNSFEAFTDGVLAWAVDDQNANTPSQVVVSGSHNRLTGRMYAHGGHFQLLGDGATIVGNVIARKVLITGDGHTIGDGTQR